MPTERICMSMIPLYPANTILQTSGEDQAADHLINGVTEMVRRLISIGRILLADSRRIIDMRIRSVGIDLGKTTFHLVALGDNCKVLLKKKFSQKQLIAFTANMQTCLIGMEACSGSHFLGRALREQGHDVKLIPAQFVKPFVKSNKNDFIDAEAIAEAVDRENMRFVPIKTDDQLACKLSIACVAGSWRQELL